MTHSGQLLDLVEVGRLHLSSENGSLLNRGEQHSGHFYIDAEDRLAGHDGVGVNARLRVANDAVILGVFELDGAERGRRQCGSFSGQFAIAGRAA